MFFLLRAGAMALVLALLLPSVVEAQVAPGTPVKAPAGFIPAQAIFCSPDAGVTWVPCTGSGGGGGGGGDASAANQSTQITAANLLNTRIGDISSPAVGSLNYRVSQVVTALAGTLTVAPHAVTQPDTRADGSLPSALNSTYAVAPNNGQDTWAFFISGTAGGVALQPQISFDGTTFTNTSAIQLAGSSSANVSTITADGRYRVKAGGARAVRLLVTTAGTGTIAIASNLSVIPYDALGAALDANRDFRVPTVTVTPFYVSLAANTSTELLGASTTRIGYELQCTGTAAVAISRTHATLSSATPSAGGADMVIPAGTTPAYIPAYVSGLGLTAYTGTAQACWGVSYARQ